MLTLFKKSNAPEPQQIAVVEPPLHPVKRVLLGMLDELHQSLMDPPATEKALPLPLRALAQSAVPISMKYLATMDDAMCVKILRAVNEYNARLCHECGIEPQRLDIGNDDAQAHGQGITRGANGER